MTRGYSHFHAVSGDHEYMPDSNVVCRTLEEAVESLSALFDLDDRQEIILAIDGYLDLDPEYGAEYAEVVACCERECIDSWERETGDVWSLS